MTLDRADVIVEYRHRGDSNPCGQSPMDFESISLAARTQCLWLHLSNLVRLFLKPAATHARKHKLTGCDQRFDPFCSSLLVFRSLLIRATGVRDTRHSSTPDHRDTRETLHDTAPWFFSAARPIQCLASNAEAVCTSTSHHPCWRMFSSNTVPQDSKGI